MKVYVNEDGYISVRPIPFTVENIESHECRINTLSARIDTIESAIQHIESSLANSYKLKEETKSYLSTQDSFNKIFENNIKNINEQLMNIRKIFIENLMGEIK